MAKDNCSNCFYRGKAGSLPCCDFFLKTGQRRPCPGGEGCTVKVPRKVNRKKAKMV